MRPVDATTHLLRLPRQRAKPSPPDPWGEHLARTDPTLGRTRWWVWAVPACVMAVAGAVGLGTPALWTDELQTWGMSVTPWDGLWPIMRWVDAVLAPYYVLMWLWTQLVGDSDIALRVPSLAAMAGAAGLIGAIGGRLAGARTGLLAGLVFAVLPAASRFGQEARPYALTAFGAALATYLLVRLLERPRPGWLAAYAGAVALTGLMHEIAILVLAGHAWYVLAFHRRLFGRWLAAAVVGGLPLAPIVWYGLRQRNQVAYIGEVGLHSAEPYLRVVIGGVAVGVLVVALALFSLPLRRPAALYTAWAVMPGLALVLVSLVVPMFLPRYLIFTLPAWALLAGAALARLRVHWAVVVLTGLLALGATAHLGVRQPAGHEGEATRDVAAVVTALAEPGDGIVYAAGERGGGWTTRDLVAHYVPADRRPKDLLVTRPPRTDGQLLAAECPQVAQCLGETRRIWVVRLDELEDPLAGLGADKERVLRADYRIERTWRPGELTLALLVRAPTAR
jgi:mannosyltransferase